MKTPEGGVIARKPGTQNLDGLVMETAYLPSFHRCPTQRLIRSMKTARPGR